MSAGFSINPLLTPPADNVAIYADLFTAQSIRHIIFALSLRGVLAVTALAVSECARAVVTPASCRKPDN